MSSIPKSEKDSTLASHSSQSQPLVTVAMATYNDEPYLSEELDSLLAQTYKNFILLLSDDGSSDRTLEIATSYAKRDARIQVVAHPKNMGSFAHLVWILTQIRTPYMMISAGHDVHDTHYIERLLQMHEDDPDLVVTYPRSREIEMDGSLGKIFQDDYPTYTMSWASDRYRYMLEHLRTCNIFQGLWKSKVMKNIYLKPVISNDVLMLLHASLLGKFRQHKEIMYFRRKTREENKDDARWKRQASMITGKYSKKSPNASLLKNKFIVENVRMLWVVDSSLSFASKVALSFETVQTWAYRFYGIPSPRQIILKIFGHKDI